ncbi:MAG: hypothetical protein IPK99_06190 [Flavobacteriales bacterium]|nr:hypothetical protein [Flavobacteriales bacterium]
MQKNRLMLIAFAALALAGCRREDKNPLNNDYTAAMDNSLAEGMFNDVLKQADDAAADGGLRGMMDGCIDTVVIDTNVMPTRC